MDAFSGLNLEITGTQALVSLILSLLTCFLGYRLMKFWVGLAGFGTGFLLGIASGIVLRLENVGTVLIIATLFGAVLALLSFKIYKVGVFLLCAVLVFALAYGLFGFGPWWQVVVSAVLGIAAGVGAVFAVRPVVIGSTAISGGIGAASMVSLFLGYFGNAPAVLTLLGAVLALAGVVVQLKTSKKEHAPKESAG